MGRKQGRVLGLTALAKKHYRNSGVVKSNVKETPNEAVWRKEAQSSTMTYEDWGNVELRENVPATRFEQFPKGKQDDGKWTPSLEYRVYTKAPGKTEVDMKVTMRQLGIEAKALGFKSVQEYLNSARLENQLTGK